MLCLGQGDCCCKEDISKIQSKRELVEEWNRRKKKEEAEMKKREEECEGIRSTGSKKTNGLLSKIDSGRGPGVGKVH